MNDFIEILDDFDKISLTELNSVKLMNRTDTKFVLSINKVPAFLKTLSSHFKILCIESNYSFSYNTLYFDTPDFAMYFKHHNKVLNRFKVRQRNYCESETVFLELKYKNNKGRTIKERIKRNSVHDNWSVAEKKFIDTRTPYLTETLYPSVFVKYNRITFLNNNLNEKITIDLNLEFSNNESKHGLENLAIIEVKQSVNKKAFVLSTLRHLKIKPFSISKYCLGVNYLYPHLKKNNFKEKLVTLNKIINDTTIDHNANI